jgi:hypothetical protein
MMLIDRADISDALKLLEDSKIEAGWSLSTVEYEGHTIQPFGKGYGVSLYSTEKSVRVYEKGHTFSQAMERAIPRLKRRLAGEEGA